MNVLARKNDAPTSAQIAEVVKYVQKLQPQSLAVAEWLILKGLAR